MPEAPCLRNAQTLSGLPDMEAEDLTGNRAAPLRACSIDAGGCHSWLAGLARSLTRRNPDSTSPRRLIG